MLYAVAWFVPVYKGQDLVAALQGFGHGLGKGLGNVPAAAQPPGGPDWLPGWQACEFAWRILVDEHTWSDDASWKVQAAGLSCLTNLVMLSIGWLALTRRTHPVLGLIALAAGALAASWLLLIHKDPFTVLRVGYFLWVARRGRRRGPVDAGGWPRARSRRQGLNGGRDHREHDIPAVARRLPHPDSTGTIATMIDWNSCDAVERSPDRLGRRLGVPWHSRAGEGALREPRGRCQPGRLRRAVSGGRTRAGPGRTRPRGQEPCGGLIDHRAVLRTTRTHAHTSRSRHACALARSAGRARGNHRL